MRQIITANPSSSNVASNSSVDLDLVYTVDPVNADNETTTGLGLRLHFDSEALTLNLNEDGQPSNILGTNFIDSQLVADTENFDNDDSTDTFLLTAWSDPFSGRWPGEGNTPTTLYTANFTTSENFNSSTSINFSTSSTAAGFEFEAESVALTPIVNDPPLLEDVTFSVIENEDVGTVVGTIAPQPSDEVEALTYALAAAEGTNLDPDGDGTNAFDISFEPGETTNVATITVTDSDDLDFETTSSFNLEVTVTDEGGLSDTATVTVNVEDLPIVENNGIFTLETASNLAFTLTNSDLNQINEIGIFTLDADGTIGGVTPDDANFASVALERSQPLFSVLANPPQGFTADISKILSSDSGTAFGLYVTPDNTPSSDSEETAAQIALSTMNDGVSITENSEGGFTVAWQEPGATDDSGFNDLILTLAATTEPPSFGTNAENSEILDLTGQTADVNFTMTLTREAQFNNVIALYEINDADGSVIDPLTGETITANQEGYITAAIANRVDSTITTVANGESNVIQGTLEAGKIYAAMLFMDVDSVELSDLNNATQVYTSFVGANSDSVDHVLSLGDNIIGFEDRLEGGDFDYNDMVAQFDFV